MFLVFHSHAGCTGFLYRNNCLRSVTTSVNVDRIPPGCSPYQPSGIWTKNDYLAICQHFGGSSNCANVDTDYNGGRCSNFQALLSYENYGSPDVWVNKNSFVWSPTDTYPDCKLISSASTVVYACNNPAATVGTIFFYFHKLQVITFCLLWCRIDGKVDSWRVLI